MHVCVSVSVSVSVSASTDLLQRLHGYMREHNVDFIGGDFNMSAFSTVGDVFTDDEFSAPGHSCLWGLGALDEQHRERTGFLIMPKRPYEWRVDSHGCYYSHMMKERSCGPYSSKAVTFLFARCSGLAVETFTDPCDLDYLLGLNE